MGCDYIKGQIRLSMKFVLFLMTTLLISAPIAVSAHGVGAYNIEVTKNYVKATGRCTCSLQADYAYHTAVFKNYCPNCHHKGTLQYEQGSGSHNPEGMWYCTRCDMDFCLVHGKEHISGSDNYLTRTKKHNVHKSTQSIKVQAQTYIEDFIEIKLGNQKYKIKKSRLKEFNDNNLGFEKLNF